MSISLRQTLRHHRQGVVHETDLWGDDAAGWAAAAESRDPRYQLLRLFDLGVAVKPVSDRAGVEPIALGVRARRDRPGRAVALHRMGDVLVRTQVEVWEPEEIAGPLPAAAGWATLGLAGRLVLVRPVLPHAVIGRQYLDAARRRLADLRGYLDGARIRRRP